MKKKVLFFLLLPLLVEMVISCCDCPELEIGHYTNKNISVSNLDNSGSGPVMANASSVPKAAYGIRVQIMRERTAVLRKSFLLPAAYAYDCECGPSSEFRARDSITAIRVLTLRDFDGSRPAGSDITAYFKAYQPYYFTTIEKFLEQWDNTLNDESELSAKIDLLLMTPPVMNTQHRFRVRVTLSDGRSIELDTPPIELT